MTACSKKKKRKTKEFFALSSWEDRLNEGYTFVKFKNPYTVILELPKKERKKK